MLRLNTVSTCTPETVQGMHVFEVFGYSQHRGIGIGVFIGSGTFSVDGRDWSIRFYPDGFSQISRDSISVYLELLGNGATARASCDLRLVDHSTGLPDTVHKTQLRKFNSDDLTRFTPQTGAFMDRRKFEASAYLRDDHLTIQCILTVRKEPRVSLLERIKVPPSNIGDHLGKLLDGEQGADVTFDVGGENFAAHKIVLAVRSPVLRALFYGSMMEAKAQQVTVEDMQPAVFRALLHFIYTDALPDMDDHKADLEFMRHLLVAADRYAVDRLKLACQSILCKNLDVKTVSTTLALAYQHNCDRLKDICLEFISSSNVLDSVVATQGYKDLKTTCPSALIMCLRRQ